VVKTARETANDYADWLESIDRFVQISFKLMMVCFLNHRYTPYYTLKKLHQHLSAFIDCQQQNKDQIIEAGISSSEFTDSWWIDRHLGKLYHMPPGLSSLSTQDSQTIGLIQENAKHIRQRMFDAKIGVTSRVRDAVNSGSCENLLSDCVGIFADHFTAAEAFDLLKGDTVYSKLEGFSPQGLRYDQDHLSGGLVSLAILVYHAERELSGMGFSKIKTELSDQLNLDIGGGSPLRLAALFDEVITNQVPILELAFLGKEPAFLALSSKTLKEFLERFRLACEARLKIEVWPGDIDTLLPGEQARPIQEILRGSARNMVASVKSLPSPKSFDKLLLAIQERESKQIMTIYEAEKIVVCDGEQFDFTDEAKFETVMIMARRQQRGFIGTTTKGVRGQLMIDERTLTGQSIGKWFKKAGGAPARFAEKHFLKSDDNLWSLNIEGTDIKIERLRDQKDARDRQELK